MTENQYTKLAKKRFCPDGIGQYSNHAEYFIASGYPMVLISDAGMSRWPEVHSWCREQFGANYVWTGSAFFFTNEKDAFWFKLAWGQ